MGKLRYAFGLLLVAAFGCSELGVGPEFEGSLVVFNGTSRNFCEGYCHTELVVDSTTVRFIEKSAQPARYPIRIRFATLTNTEWGRIRALADTAALSSVAGVHGCPDCADGGAEWVEIRTVGDSTRATFEYGHVLDPISELQAELRALRQQLQ